MQYMRLPMGLSEEDVVHSVLVVDDTETNLELMDAVLSHAGYRVYTAADAEAAHEVFRTKAIDIAILDVMMPGINGYQLCAALKRSAGRRFFPIILLTALQGRDDRIAGLEAGADDFISKPFDTAELFIRIRNLVKLKELQEELDHSEDIIFSLIVAMESRDHYTKGHSTRVGDYARKFGAFLGFSEKDQHLLRKAGLLHDIGKIGMSESILRKTTSLSDEETSFIKKHTIIGEEICRSLTSLRGILPAIRSHHERWDGEGFPDGLCGEEIPLIARVLAIVDSYDAMVSMRPYRQGRSFGAALSVLESEHLSGQWDPALTSLFLEMMRVAESRDQVLV